MAYADSWALSDFTESSVENSCMSSNGQYGYLCCYSNGTTHGIWSSNDYGHTWVHSIDLSASFPDMPGIVCSDSGQYLYCAINEIGTSGASGIYKSIDYGANWSFINEGTLGFEIQASNLFKVIACSSSGQIVYVNAVDTSDGDAKIFKSSDYGATWLIVYTDLTSGIASQSITCDATGDTVFCLYLNTGTSSNDGLLSVNAGSSFTTITGTGWSPLIAMCGMSADGQVIYTYDQSTAFHYSINQGSTWTTHIAADGIASASISPDGVNFALGLFGFDMEVSSNSGSSWTTITPDGVGDYWATIAQSTDGTKLIAGSINGMYYSPGAAFSITSITPSTGSTTGGTPVTIVGVGFDPAATAAIDGNDLTSVTVVDSTTITGITPAGTVGAKDVTVTNP